MTSFFAILAILASSKKPVYRKKGQLLLVNEQRFLTAALQALPPDILLTFKVRLIDIVSSRNASNGKNLEAELSDYVVDFLLVDRHNTEPRLCIEMIMEGRDSAANSMVGRALRRAGIPHLKLPLVRFYDPIRLRQLFLGAMSNDTAKDV
ncbi:MAG: DUF2726 domain-containing protein [Alphaproteobacteria bacterium]|nr:DUF2726 domain-containing protein [Alphaproteobacteria bacterium]